MDLVVFAIGFGLVAIGYSLAPQTRDDRPGLLRFIPEDANAKTERRFRMANTALWIVCLALGMVLISFGFLR